MEANTWTTRLLKKKSIAKDMVELHFLRPEGFSFLAGQFIQFFVPDGEKTAKRSYSLSSDPKSSHIEVCLKLLPGGVASAFFEQAAEATSIDFSGPQGKFICTASELPLHFIATGSGLAPILSIIIDELKNKKNGMAIDLLFGVRSQADVFWLERLDSLAQSFPNFAYRLTLSQPDPGWTGMEGRVTEHLAAPYAAAKYFLCGSADMVKDAQALLIARGAETRNLHIEIF